MAGGLGFEPRFSESESDVLPLNYPPPKGLIFLQDFLEFWKSSGKFWKSDPTARPYRASGVHGLVLNEPEPGTPAGGHLHLVFEAHVVLDHLPGHADVVGDLVDIVALSVPSQDAGAAQPVNGRVLRVLRIDVP